MHVKSHIICISSNKVETKLYTKPVTKKKKIGTLGSRMVYSKWLCITVAKINGAAQKTFHTKYVLCKTVQI